MAMAMAAHNVTSSGMSPQAPAAAGFGAAPFSKALRIVDPKTGDAIEIPASWEPRAPQHKPLAIKDPTTGTALDTKSLHWGGPPQPRKALPIIDPGSGTTIKI